ncbi:hypothetical protein PCI56_03985 [Plesiomonas shigelloides subsp. oncorhynchi]|nr:hypothetical protein [Plesiomonas shigelloides]
MTQVREPLPRENKPQTNTQEKTGLNNYTKRQKQKHTHHYHRVILTTSHIQQTSMVMLAISTAVRKLWLTEGITFIPEVKKIKLLKLDYAYQSKSLVKRWMQGTPEYKEQITEIAVKKQSQG